MFGQKSVPSRAGGVEVVVGNLAKRMAARGNDVTLLNRKRHGAPQKTEWEGCHIQNIFTINHPKLDAIVYSFFASLKARKGGYDIIHIHAEGPCFFLPLLAKKRKRKYKIIVTIHGLDWQRGKWGGIASKILKSGEKKAAKYADEIIVLSRNNVQYFQKKYNRQTTYIPNGIENPIFHVPEIIQDKFGLTKDSYILFLARLVPEKGAHYLIEAWQEVRAQTHTTKKLVIAGFDEHSLDYFARIKDMVKEDDSIILTGFVTGQLLEELYTNAFLYVLPSDIEGMPISLLEARSYGKICLVSDIPENIENIGPKDFSFKAGDIKDLSKKLIDILLTGSSNHENYGFANDWDKVVETTLNLYRKEEIK